MGTIVGTIASVVIGAVVAGGAVFGVVASQTSAPDKSPASVNSPQIDYGTNS